MLIYKCRNELVPPYLAGLLKLYEPSHTLRSGSQMNLKAQKTHLKSYCNKAFCHTAPVLWNNQPLQIKTAFSLDVFKSKLTYLLYSSNDEATIYVKRGNTPISICCLSNSGWLMSLLNIYQSLPIWMIYMFHSKYTVCMRHLFELVD